MLSPRAQFDIHLTIGRRIDLGRLDPRYRRVGLAVLTSGGARLFRFCVQLLLVGMMLRHLGAETYGLWIAVVASLGWLSWGQAGLAPGLVTVLAEAEGAGRGDLAAAYFTTALYAISSVAALLFITASLALEWSLATFDLGVLMHSGGWHGRPALPALAEVALGLALLRFPMALIESAYVAVQRIHILRAFEIAGQLASLLAAGFLISMQASAASLVLGIGLAAEGAIALAGVYLIFRLKPGLRPIPRRFSLSASGRLFNLSFGYLILQIGGYLLVQAGIVILAAYEGTAAVAKFSLAWQLYQMASGIWVMVATSLWGALAEARTRKEWEWIATARRRLVAMTIALSTLFSLGLALFGPWLIAAWSGGQVQADRVFTVAIALHCGMFSWAVVNAQILNALGAVWQQGLPALMNGLLAGALTFLLVPGHGATGLAVALFLATALSTAWLLPSILNRLVRDHVAAA